MVRFSLEAGVFRSVSRSVSICLLVLEGDWAGLLRSSIDDGSDFTLLEVAAVEHFDLLLLLVVPCLKRRNEILI